MNEACHIWVMNEAYCICVAWLRHVTCMKDVTYERVMSHMNQSCHMWMSHVTFCDMTCSYVTWLFHLWHSIWMSHITFEWVICDMPHKNKSCRRHGCMCTSHVTHESVMSHMNESRHTWMSHVTHEWVTWHMNESCPTWMSHVRYEWVMSHIRLSHVTHMSEPYHTYEWVMSHIGMRHVTRTNDSRHTYDWVTLMSRVNLPCHTRMNPVT